VTSGRAHAQAERWAAAYADYTQAIERQPNYYNAWVERASLEVGLGLWKRAAEDYSKALELGVPADNPASWGIPQLFLFNGDKKSYREYCLGLLKQSEQDPQRVSIPVMRSCVIAAEPVTDPAEVANRMEELLDVIQRSPFDGPGPPEYHPADDRNVRRPLPPPDGFRSGPRGPGDDRTNEPHRLERGRPNGPRRPPPDNRGGPPPDSHNRLPYPYGAVLYVAGLAHYRAGQFDDAVARLSQALDDRGWRERSIAYPALAMAYHRNGQADEAKEALASAEEAIDQWTQEMLEAPVGRMPLLWFDWIECQLLYREARLLLTGFAPADDPRLRTIEQRALAAIQGDASP
jgi:tetratricopeptide (TPR) repeat protein